MAVHYDSVVLNTLVYYTEGNVLLASAPFSLISLRSDILVNLNWIPRFVILLSWHCCHLSFDSPIFYFRFQVMFCVTTIMAVVRSCSLINFEVCIYIDCFALLTQTQFTTDCLFLRRWNKYTPRIFSLYYLASIRKSYNTTG